MTSLDLIRELQTSRPTASESLRARVRDISTPAASPARRRRPKLALPRPVFVLVPAAAAIVLAVGAAGVAGLAGSGANQSAPTAREANIPSASGSVHGEGQTLAPETKADALAPTPGRAQQVDATLTVKVPDSDQVSRAAQDALDLTRSLGGHVQNASVTTGDQAQATLTLRIPADKTEDAVTRLSALGAIVSQRVSIQDLQERLDALVRRARSVHTQIVEITARLESQQLTPEQRAALEIRRHSLGTELASLRRAIRSTHSVASFATVEVSVVTPASLGVAPTTSRLDRSLDKAVEVLVWEGIVALVILLVAAPLALLALATLLVRRLYRRHEEDRLLATS
jgi:Domain of unknown function (DUF4349)